MNFFGADETTTAMVRPAPSRETLQALKQQQQLLAELVERPELPKADRQRTPPSAPRSQGRMETITI